MKITVWKVLEFTCVIFTSKSFFSPKICCKNISHTRKSWKNKMRWHGNMLNFKHNYENTNEPFSRKMCQRRHFWNTGTALFIYIWKASSPWRSYAGIAWLVTLRHDVDEKLCHFSSCCIILFKKFVRCLDKCKKSHTTNFEDANLARHIYSRK